MFQSVCGGNNICNYLLKSRGLNLSVIMPKRAMKKMAFKAILFLILTSNN